MLQAVRNYVKDDSALDAEVSKIIAIVLVIVVIMALGWFAWNQIGKRADVATNEIESSSNPGSGSEFSGNPFGN